MPGVPLHFDTTLKEEPIGLVADYCPICWKPEKFKCWDVYCVKRLNVLLTLGRKYTGLTVRCSQCNFTRSSVSTQRYAGIIQEDLPLTRLIEMTFPNLFVYYAEQIELGSKMHRSATLSTEERKEAIGSVLNYVALEVEKICSKDVEIDRRSVMGCLATILLCVGSTAILTLLAANNLPLLIMTPVCLISLGTLTTIVSLGRQHRRYSRRIGLPLCGRGLKLLRPSYEEIQAELRRLRDQRLKINRFLTATMILDAVQECS
jgi:hypothetical protein